MSALAGLKLVAAKRPMKLSPIQLRRERLAGKLAEQIQLAQAMQEGRTQVFTRTRKEKDEATGEWRVEQVPKRVRQCWWKAEGGKLCFAVRYGSKDLELAKGRSAVEVAAIKDLVLALEAVLQAVFAGELDAQLEAASKNVRAGFKR